MLSLALSHLLRCPRGLLGDPIRDMSFIWHTKSGGTEISPNEESTAWWTSREIIPRPWEEKRQKTVPVEQTEGFVRTREVSIPFSDLSLSLLSLILLLPRTLHTRRANRSSLRASDRLSVYTGARAGNLLASG